MVLGDDFDQFRFSDLNIVTSSAGNLRSRPPRDLGRIKGLGLTF
jgi:hypothetical protein